MASSLCPYFPERGFFGRYAGGMPLAEYSSRIRFRSGGNGLSGPPSSGVPRPVMPVVRLVVPPRSGSMAERRPSAFAVRSRRIEGCQNGATLRIDEIDSTKIPACVTHDHFTEVAESAGISKRTPSSEIVPSPRR